MRKHSVLIDVAALLVAAPLQAANVRQDAMDSCTDGRRASLGATGGSVPSAEYPEANSLVLLQAGDGQVRRCLVSNDGSNPYLEAQGVPAGGGSASSQPGPAPEAMPFGAARSGTDLGGGLSRRRSEPCIPGASDGQVLHVAFWTTGPAIECQIFVANGKAPLGMMSKIQRDEGSLFMDGDHAIDAGNRSGSPAPCNMSAEIR